MVNPLAVSRCHCKAMDAFLLFFFQFPSHIPHVLTVSVYTGCLCPIRPQALQEWREDPSPEHDGRF